MSDANIFPEYRGVMEYFCLGCGEKYPIGELLYTCPKCGEVLLLEDNTFAKLKEKPGTYWRELFDARAATKRNSLRGIFRFYELIAPIIEENDIIYLGEGNTPVIEASKAFQEIVGQRFAFKNEGQNPSASFKDRGMACAFSFLKTLARHKEWKEVLAVCASTGDTSAAAALYASYVGEPLKSVVLLPGGKVTSQQISQPLGSGATVLELPGVFDDCMKVVEFLAERYKVALLNSKNSWRILGQESFAFETAQWADWNMDKFCIFVPVGNAGNITAILRGFLKLHEMEIISSLPRVFGVQSQNADPVYRYYSAPKETRKFEPVKVKPSVAQAAMIGNPVSFPRVKYLAERYEKIAGEASFHILHVTEQEIMDNMLLANRNGHIACTQGGESLAGLITAKQLGLVKDDEFCLLDSTAHALKFMDFQNLYFDGAFPDTFAIHPKAALVNRPQVIMSAKERTSHNEKEFVLAVAARIVHKLGLEPKHMKTEE